MIEGDIRVSGHPKEQKTFARVMGYCEQVCTRMAISRRDVQFDAARSCCDHERLGGAVRQTER